MTDDPATARLLADLDALAGRTCPGCPRPVCGHEVLFSVALGCRDAPRCLGCLAASLGREADELRGHLADHFRARDCFRAAWADACRREGVGDTFSPPCLPSVGRFRPDPAPAPTGLPGEGGSFYQWDAGDLACGELVLALRRRLNEMPAGAVLEIVCRDPAAPEDLPAWCRLTGHRLCHADHPRYRIQRKDG